MNARRAETCQTAEINYPMKPHPATLLKARTASPYEHNSAVECVGSSDFSAATAAICTMPAV